ncbi:MAG: GCN5-related N-acetyltransferase, partial [Frankiales bacterium]|nr:GCN5-related N-acetyltransferase [Frankiales bacterium]
SRLVSVVHGTPEQLHTRFAHYGVWTLGQIAAVAANGGASALLIADTERLNRPVGHDRLQQLARRAVCRLGPLLSPTAVPDSLFEAAYTEGIARG